MSCNRDINAPAPSESVRGKLSRILFANSLKQQRTQPSAIATPNAQRVLKNSRLVPTARVRRIQAIILELTNVEDCLLAIRQTRHAVSAVRRSRSVAVADRQLLGREQGDDPAALVGDDDLLLDAGGGIAVARRTIGLEREHHAF